MGLTVGESSRRKMNQLAILNPTSASNISVLFVTIEIVSNSYILILYSNTVFKNFLKQRIQQWKGQKVPKSVFFIFGTLQPTFTVRDVTNHSDHFLAMPVIFWHVDIMLWITMRKYFIQRDPSTQLHGFGSSAAGGLLLQLPQCPGMESFSSATSKKTCDKTSGLSGWIPLQQYGSMYNCTIS